MALLCSSRWSDQNSCETECVALKTSFQTRPMWALQTHLIAIYRSLKWGSKFCIFYETLKIFTDFMQQKIWMQRFTNQPTKFIRSDRTMTLILKRTYPSQHLHWRFFQRCSAAGLAALAPQIVSTPPCSEHTLTQKSGNCWHETL
jgi:hypothetical protein